MVPLAAADIRGVWGTVLLPLTDTDDIAVDRLGDELDTLVAAGVDGLYVHGTAGEFHTLDEHEFDLVNDLVARRCEAAGMAFQIGASYPTAPVTMERIRRAADLAPGAIQVILPDWVPMNDDEVLRFLVGAAAVADDVPLVLYNPPHAKTPVSPALMSRLLREVPGLVGLKTAGGDDAWYAAMRELTGDLSVFVPGHLLASGIRRGAHGSYSNVAALSPRGAVAWHRLMLRDIDAGLDVERRISEFFDLHIAPLQARRLSNPALDKFLAAVGGWADVGVRTRWPASAAPESAVAAARADARRLVPELFPD